MIKTDWMVRKSNERVPEEMGRKRNVTINIMWKGKSNVMGILSVTMIFLIINSNEDQEEDLDEIYFHAIIEKMVSVHPINN